jgi:hypothetical protein
MWRVNIKLNSAKFVALQKNVKEKRRLKETHGR